MKDLIPAMIDVAAGRAKAQMVFKDINLINVLTGEIYKTDVAIHDGYIAGIGTYEGAVELDMDGKYLAPGFIDSHVHMESAMVTPGEFAKAIVPRGTTSIIADPHEIANVKGVAGIQYMLDSTDNLPLEVYMMLPSCVPATPFENAGSVLKAKDLQELIHHPRVLGLGELMDFPSVVSCEKSIMEKILLAVKANKPIDGHGPTLTGKPLNAYITAGVLTDHECTTVEEAVERLRLGMYVMLREGSAAKNLIDLLPAFNETSIHRCMFCTDDRHPEDILSEGHIDNAIRLAIQHGIPPVKAIQMATINPARCYELKQTGAIAPGYKADLVVLDRLEDIKVYQVYKGGKLVAEKGLPLFSIKPINDSRMRNSIHIQDLQEHCFQIEASTEPSRIIGLIPHSLITKDLTKRTHLYQGKYFTEDSIPLLKIAVIERHHATGNIGLGLVEGLGLQNGAIATSIAHDSHNIIVIGDHDRDMKEAVSILKDMGGGISIVSNGERLAAIPLPIGGIMSDLSLDELKDHLHHALETAYTLGVSKDFEPFMTLAFLALPVIPSLKITDLGLFDVNKFEFV